MISKMTFTSALTFLSAVLVFGAPSASAGIITSVFDGLAAADNSDTTEWSYRFQNGSEVRDGSYSLLGSTLSPTTFTNVPISGYDLGGGTIPGFFFNDTGSSVNFGGVSRPDIVLGDGDVWLHPAGDSLVVASYLSPVAQTVDVGYSFTHLDPSLDVRSNGVQFFVDLGDASGNLSSGSLLRTSTGMLNLSGVSLAAGDRLNFVLTSNGSNFFDSTALSATISSIDEPTMLPAPSTLSLLAIMVVMLRRRLVG